MFQKITLGLIQMRCDAPPSDNIVRALKKAEDCAKRGAQIIILPELFLSHYFCQGPKDDAYFDLAETIPGPTTEAFSSLAKKYKAVVILSLFEKTKQGKFFNTIAVVGTQGEIIGTYHKMHIPSLPADYYAETYYFEKGDEGFKVFKTPYGNIGTLICYDQWFPEAARIAASKGADILVYPTAIGWPVGNPAWKKKAEHEAWQITQRSHGIDNNVFVAAVNRIGREQDIKFWGTSFVSSPYGQVLAKATTSREQNVLVKIDYSVTKEMRTEWPFLDERRVKVENCKD